MDPLQLQQGPPGVRGLPIEKHWSKLFVSHKLDFYREHNKYELSFHHPSETPYTQKWSKTQKD